MKAVLTLIGLASLASIATAGGVSDLKDGKFLLCDGPKKERTLNPAWDDRCSFLNGDNCRTFVAVTRTARLAARACQTVRTPL